MESCSARKRLRETITGASGSCSPSATGVNASSAMRPALTSIEALLETLRADAAIGVEEAFAVAAKILIVLDHIIDSIHDAFPLEAGSQNLHERGIFRARTSQTDLILLHTFAFAAHYANIASRVLTN